MKRIQFKAFSLIYSALVLLISSSCLYAEQTTTVFKVVNPDGSISYSDQPQHNAEELQVSPISTIPAFSLPQGTSTTPVVEDYSDAGNNKPVSNPYYSVEISSPANDSAFYSGSGNVDVIVDLVPSLASNDRIQFQLDGVTVATKSSAQHTLKTLNRGSHTINVTVMNSTGKVLNSTSSAFTVHRPIKRR